MGKEKGVGSSGVTDQEKGRVAATTSYATTGFVYRDKHGVDSTNPFFFVA